MYPQSLLKLDEALLRGRQGILLRGQLAKLQRQSPQFGMHGLKAAAHVPCNTAAAAAGRTSWTPW